MSEVKPQSKYIYCYNQALPTSLVMLQDSDKIIQSLLTNPYLEQTTMIIINHKQQQSLQQLIDTIKAQLQIQLVKYCSIQLLLTHLQQKRFTQKVLIVCPLQMKQQLLNNNYIQCLICYPAQENINIQGCNHYLYYAEDKEQLKNILLTYKNTNKKQKYKWLPNFLHLNYQVQTSNLLIKTLWAMINQQYDSVTNHLILTQLNKLIKKMQNFEISFSTNSIKSQQFIQQLQKGSLSCQRSIYWYTVQSPIYKLINNLLRSTQYPCLLFYIQPYFKDLFKSIQSLYNTQKYKRQFICYRGGMITEQELVRFFSNLGGMVQNLGFFSTTLSKEITEAYIKNVLFQIIVDEQHNTGFSFGYANIAEFSQYFEQAEVLFNPLNFFKILSIKEITQDKGKIFLIQLLFRGTAEKQGLGSQEKKLNQFLLRKAKNLKQEMKCQGSALLSFYRNHEQVGFAYWKKRNELIEIKFKQLSETKIKIIKQMLNKLQITTIEKQIRNFHKQYIIGFKAIGQYYYAKGEYEKARHIYEKCQQDLKNSVYTKDLIYVDCLVRLAKIYSTLNILDKSLDLYQKLQILILEIFGKYNSINVLVKTKQGIIYFQKLDFQTSLRLYDEAIRINERLFGIDNYESLQILNGIAYVYLAKQKHSKSLQYFSRILKINKKVYGNHFCYSDILNQIGEVYKSKGEFQKSLVFIKKALKIWKQFYGIEHPTKAKYLLNIGQVFYNLKQYQTSLQYFEYSLRMLKKFKLQKTKLYIQNLICIARIYFNKKQINKSLHIYQNAKEITNEALPKNHKTYMDLLNFMAEAYIQKRQYDSALGLYEKQQQVLIFCKQKFKSSYAFMLNNVAVIYMLKKQLAKALPVYQAQLQVKRSIYGISHRFLARTILNIANINLVNRNYSKALQINRQYEMNIMKELGNLNHEYILYLAGIINIYDTIGDLRTALALQIKQIKIKEKVFGKQHMEYLMSLIRKANLQKNRGLFFNALKTSFFIIRPQQWNKNNLWYIQGWKNVIQIYIYTNNLHKFKKYVQKDYQLKIPKLMRKKILKKISQNSHEEIHKTINYIDLY